MEDVLSYTDSGGTLPSVGKGFTGPLERTITMDNLHIGYRAVQLPDGTVSIGTYFIKP